MSREPIEILAIPGSVRARSHNLRLLNAASRAAGPRAEFRILDSPRLGELPPFDPDAAPTDAVIRLREAVASADGLLVATPEYNASLPGGLKNALDWASLPREQGELRGKPAAVIGAGQEEFGSDWAQADTRKVLEAAGARVVAAGVGVALCEDAFAEDDSLVSKDQGEALAGVIDELITESSPLA